MAATRLKELVEDEALVMPFSVEQYHRMIETGILPEGEPFELLEGYVVRKDRSAAGGDPKTVGHHHAWVVKKLAALDGKLQRHGCHMQTQQPVTLPPMDEPEPDAAIVKGPADEYLERHPGAADVLCVS